VEDTHFQRLSANEKYSAKSGYDHQFMGATLFKPCERIWKSWVPPKCQFFLWLAAHKRCWTVDRLAHRGLPHQDKCPLCDQEDENIDHLLVSCVFSRQVWYYMLRQVGLHSLAPQPIDLVFDDWWEKATTATSGMSKKGLNSLIILGALAIWNHHNRCVFDHAHPCMVEVLTWVGEEKDLDDGESVRAILPDGPPPRILVCC
jgi:hypothetical protein